MFVKYDWRLSKVKELGMALTSGSKESLCAQLDACIYKYSYHELRDSSLPAVLGTR